MRMRVSRTSRYLKFPDTYALSQPSFVSSNFGNMIPALQTRMSNLGNSVVARSANRLTLEKSARSSDQTSIADRFTAGFALIISERAASPFDADLQARIYTLT